MITITLLKVKIKSKALYTIRTLWESKSTGRFIRYLMVCFSHACYRTLNAMKIGGSIHFKKL
jgi:hypothetical protein